MPAVKYGIDYELFWSLTPRTLSLLLKGIAEKQKLEYNKIDIHNHHLGQYMIMAIGQALDSKTKNIYPIKPIFQVDENDIVKKEYTETEKEILRLRLRMKFDNIMRAQKQRK